MEIIYYSIQETRQSLALEKCLAEGFQLKESHICRTPRALKQALSTPRKNPPAVILHLGAKPMGQIIELGYFLEKAKVLVALENPDPALIRSIHSLHPRFLAPLPDHREDLLAVLRHMKNTRR